MKLSNLESELVTYEMSLDQGASDTIEKVLQAKVDQPKNKGETSNLSQSNQPRPEFQR